MCYTQCWVVGKIFIYPFSYLWKLQGSSASSFCFIVHCILFKKYICLFIYFVVVVVFVVLAAPCGIGES